MSIPRRAKPSHPLQLPGHPTDYNSPKYIKCTDITQSTRRDVEHTFLQETAMLEDVPHAHFNRYLNNVIPIDCGGVDLSACAILDGQVAKCPPFAGVTASLLKQPVYDMTSAIRPNARCKQSHGVSSEGRCVGSVGCPPAAVTTEGLSVDQ